MRPAAIEVTALVTVLIRATVLLLWTITHTLDPSGLTATPTEPEPTVIGVTALVLVLIRETVPLPLFVTQTLDPSGLTATP